MLYAADGNQDPEVVDFEIRAVRTDGTCDRLVASGPDYDIAPSWSKTPGLVAWASFRAGQARVVLQDVQGGPQRVLDTGPEFSSGPALSPDGAVVAFERLAAGEATGDVYVVPVAGGSPVELAAGSIEVKDGQGNVIGTCAANDAGPVFSDTAEGRFVYFVSTRSSTSCSVSSQVTEVWRQPLDQAWAPTGAPERLTTDSGIVGKPAVSPDGRSIAYARPSSAAGSFGQVVLHAVATGQERVVTDESDSEPDFAPTGDALAVKTTRFSALGDVVLVDLATGAVRKRLTSGEILVGSPAFPR